MADRWLEARRAIARHSKSFDLASRLFPAERRNEVAALYGWCRACDDAIDLRPKATHAETVGALHRQLDEIYRGVPQSDPILACFQEVVERRRIPIDYPLELLRGMAMDVEGATYDTLDELLVYCWRVAGTVGLMMCHVMGVSDDEAPPHAAHLGIAMQLTNIARDVGEDWRRGRVYLPAELMDAELAGWLRANTREADAPPLPERTWAELAGARRRLLREADRYYASADAGMRYLEPRSALAVRTARLVYAEIGRQIEAQGADALQQRAVVPRRRKLRLAAGALRRFVSEASARSVRQPLPPSITLRGADAVRLP